ncbi:hypothetical protein AAC387_Pa02g4356 [Persea americana]
MGEKLVCLDRTEEEKNLAIYFVHAMKENRLFEMLEERVQSKGLEEQLKAIAQLAMRCLNFRGEERPTMKVAADLQGLRGFQDHPWVNNKETLRGFYVKHPKVLGCVEDARGQIAISFQHRDWGSRLFTHFEYR